MRGKASHGEATGGKWKGSNCRLHDPAAVAGVLWPGQPSQAVTQEWKDFWEEGKEVLRATDPELRRRSACPSPRRALVSNALSMTSVRDLKQHLWDRADRRLTESVKGSRSQGAQCSVPALPPDVKSLTPFFVVNFLLK